MPRQREEKEKNTFLILGLLGVLCVHATGGVESKFDAGRVIDHDNSAKFVIRGRGTYVPMRVWPPHSSQQSER